MLVRRLVVAEHELLQQLAAYVAALAVPPPPCLERGDLGADIAAGPPTVDRCRPRAFRFHAMQWSNPEWMPAGATLSSVNYFPAGGAGLGWHTDSSRPGWRVYIGRPLSDVAGALIVPGRILEDVPGIANAFYLSDADGPLSWHAVRADGPRFSVGIRGPAMEAALGLYRQVP